MSASRFYCVVAARAIWELDRCSLRAPEGGQDRQDWQKARELLYALLERNGYQLAEPGGKRIKRRPAGRS